MLILVIMSMASKPSVSELKGNADPMLAKKYFIDPEKGNDSNSGLSPEKAIKTLRQLQRIVLIPGDTLLFKRGAEFIGPLRITKSGSASRYITLTAYGDLSLPAPAFTNPVFVQDNFGNCIRVSGDYIIIENLRFQHTTAFKPGNYHSDGFETWEMGAVYIDKNGNHCIVRNNEFFDCVVGIKSYGKHTLISHNYIHDCNRVLKEWNWGPIGIWLGNDHQEVCFNRIFNYRAEDSRIKWPQGIGGGADGGAIEIDDARFDKLHIRIHHNYTRDCQGFLEVTWSDVKTHPDYENFEIHHNISDDYQQFMALWNGSHCRIENNTIIRRKVNANDWGVFNITQNYSDNMIRNNIIVVEKDIVIFNTGLQQPHTPESIISHNLYFAASGRLCMGLEGPGNSPVYGNPEFINYKHSSVEGDFVLAVTSPAIDQGEGLGYRTDYTGTPIPQGSAPDIGAFEFTPVNLPHAPLSALCPYSP